MSAYNEANKGSAKFVEQKLARSKDTNTILVVLYQNQAWRIASVHSYYMLLYPLSQLMYQAIANKEAGWYETGRATELKDTDKEFGSVMQQAVHNDLVAYTYAPVQMPPYSEKQYHVIQLMQ